MIDRVGLFSLVSVIIPTFNRANFLVRAIDSVINQSYKNIEIIVIDDGSTDDTDIVIGAIAKRNNNLICVTKNNGGCASARNKGLELARGNFITFLDSDDQWGSEAIEAMMRKLKESAAEFVYSPSIEFYPDGRKEINYPVAAREPEKLAKAHFMFTNIRNGSYMFTRSALEKVGKLDEGLKYNEDSDYVQRLSIHCKSAYLSSPTVIVYNHENSKSRNRIEIYKALLKSSEKTLIENPGFATQLGTDAKKRIQQIKAQLVEALIIHNEFGEANSIAKDVFGCLRLTVKIAIVSGSNSILDTEYLLRKYLSIIKKRLIKYSQYR